jgi:hypothetical protein
MMGVRVWLVGSTVAALLATAALVVVQFSRSSPPPPVSALPPPPPIISIVVPADPAPPPVVRRPRPKLLVNDPATLGDRARTIAAKNELKAYVARGEGFDSDRRMLRALCRQLGDMSCVN